MDCNDVRDLDNMRGIMRGIGITGGISIIWGIGKYFSFLSKNRQSLMLLQFLESY